jgi:putative ubiquitin-RnfH superfamily antitoxin RatB of RatAB toxin-antitoxin module
LGLLPWRDHVSETVAQSLQVSVWGRLAQPDTALREDDRIELTRALRVDPKVARRERFDSQGKRTAGLFARRRS